MKHTNKILCALLIASAAHTAALAQDNSDFIPKLGHTTVEKAGQNAPDNTSHLSAPDNTSHLSAPDNTSHLSAPDNTSHLSAPDNTSHLSGMSSRQ